ncbi:MAG: HAMP domain-containing sensor histidine kinase [Hoeflea sp.]|uniref:sensor histidine kinase n=1 Tax=Hoeflea sp. TaxID=1940281 RepID=UPI00273044C2|nr:HAMP domain-containing sensor histidine kinase [Hoeflea sp.]MDP2118826.1 HAMP domain-containing sensor histidine kinase [Hoeflea sp.]MDP3525880.1 HAMP domain-containing sensor histidine kinase [Hoeflea sp.]
MADTRASDTEAGEAASEPRAASLSSKLLWLTILFVMIAEVLIFVPSVANTRVRWLADRLNTAAAAAVVIDAVNEMELPQSIQDGALMATGTKAIVLRKDGASRMIASADMPPVVTHQYDLSAVTPVGAVIDAFDTFLFGGDRVIRVYGPVADDPAMQIELVLADAPLRHAMLIYGRNVFFLSVLISIITAGLVFFAINRIMIGPVRRMTENMQAFSEDPENPRRVIVPRQVGDELGVAEGHLAAMQSRLQQTLKEQRHLADLGLAVSKINHDMRNILTSAQLMSDRLSMIDDPMVKRFAPKLLRTIDRAVSYSGEVLAYGKAREAKPRRRFINLATLAGEVRDIVTEETEADITYVLDIDTGLEVEADSDQMFRVIYNLVRNAVQAFGADPTDDPALVRRITLSARRSGAVVEILVADTGPGLPAKARENLFQPFRGSARSGGTGLGLAIARELVLAHGGSITLDETVAQGAAFRIELPDQPVPLDTFRARA